MTPSHGTVHVLRWISEPVENGLGLRVAWIEARVMNPKKDQGSQQIASGNKAAELAKTGAESDAAHSDQVAEDEWANICSDQVPFHCEVDGLVNIEHVEEMKQHPNFF